MNTTSPHTQILTDESFLKLILWLLMGISGLLLTLIIWLAKDVIKKLNLLQVSMNGAVNNQNIMGDHITGLTKQIETIQTEVKELNNVRIQLTETKTMVIGFERQLGEFRHTMIKMGDRMQTIQEDFIKFLMQEQSNNKPNER